MRPEAATPAASPVEEELIATNALLHAVMHAQSQFIAQTAAADVFAGMLESLLQLTDSEYGFIGEVVEGEHGKHYLQTHAITNIAWNEETLRVYREQAPNFQFFNLDNLFGTVLVTGEPVITNDPDNDARRGGLPKGHPELRSFLGVPIRHGDRLLGMAGVANRPAGYDESHISYLQPFLMVCGNMIEAVQNDARRRRAEAQLEEKHRLLESTNTLLQEALEQLRSAQSTMLVQERLRALGTMAGGIAHDFNNALGLLLGYTELLLDDPERKLRDYPLVLRYVKNMNQAARNAADVVKRLREFYRGWQESERPRPVDLNSLAAQAVDLTRPRWKDHCQENGIAIEMKTVLAEVPAVLGHEAELRVALTNLIVNSVEAMPQGGVITLRTSLASEASVPFNALEAAPQDPESPSSLVLLSIQDNGAGMNESTRQRCLDPFFTTRGESGKGLGLSIVYGILRRHGGGLHIESREGEGTTVLLALPAAADATGNSNPVRPPDSESQETDRVGRSLKVLVVDDEPDSREVLESFLADDGHEVVLAEDGWDGLQKFHGGSFDLVVTDCTMPKMNGEQFARAIKGLSPQTPVLMITGFGHLMNESGQKPAGVDLVLGKPPTVAEVRRAVASLSAR